MDHGPASTNKDAIWPKNIMKTKNLKIYAVQ